MSALGDCPLENLREAIDFIGLRENAIEDSHSLRQSPTKRIEKKDRMPIKGMRSVPGLLLDAERYLKVVQ